MTGAADWDTNGTASEGAVQHVSACNGRIMQHMRRNAAHPVGCTLMRGMAYLLLYWPELMCGLSCWLSVQIELCME